jgi:tRNA uridine 5-carboxymethylaminomethyl modification enzyme
LDLLRRPNVRFDDLQHAAPVAAGDDALDSEQWRADERLCEQVKQQVEVQARYAGYLKRQTEEIDRQQRHEALRLPDDFDYARLSGLSHEVRQRLHDVRPETLGQAARIPGLTPAAISLLLVHLRKRGHAA